jgi:hypothetical protein
MSKPYGVRARINSLALTLKKRLGQSPSRSGSERHSKAAFAGAGQARADENGPEPVNELSVVVSAP